MRTSATGIPNLVLPASGARGEGDRTKCGGGAFRRREPLHHASHGPPPHRFATGRTERGFTLIELLVVLVIIGLVSAAVIVGMPDPRGALRGEALRLAARADAARERAMMDNRPVALVLKEGGYGFEWRTGGEWKAMSERPFIEQSWSRGTRASMEGGESRIVFDSTGFAEPARLRLVRGKEEARVEVTDGGRIHVVR
ncbi:MAG TPA: GspH/FimT family pseudopilin [Allosphingosinicella sp.]